MKNSAREISSILSWSSIILTIIALLATGLSQISWAREQLKNGADLFLFFLIWSYILLTPILSGFGLYSGDTRRGIIRANIIALIIWLVFFLWTLTMTL
jgi:hypothetical protein